MKLEFLKHEPQESAKYAVVWLHGLGADGHDFQDMVVAMNLPRTRFILPHAPHRPITINNGYEMRGWYDIHGFSLETREDQDGVAHSAQLVRQLITEQCADIAHENIIIAGFSQGAAMALYLCLTSPQRFAGVIALSGYLPLRQHLEARAVQDNSKTPIFLAHGQDDTIVPYSFGEITKNYLLSQGYTPAWHAYAMGHSVCDQEVRDIRQWLHKITV